MPHQRTCEACGSASTSDDALQCWDCGAAQHAHSIPPQPTKQQPSREWFGGRISSDEWFVVGLCVLTVLLFAVIMCVGIYNIFAGLIVVSFILFMIQYLKGFFYGEF